MRDRDLPEYDDAGINLADQNDHLGRKTEYISRLQQEALVRYVGKGHGVALDVGCGYGRMTHRISELGYQVIGIEPSLRVLRYASRRWPKFCWLVGKLPDLPVAGASAELVLLLNVVRPLHLLGLRDLCAGAARAVAPGGRLVVLDNIRAADARYVEEDWFLEFFKNEGMVLERRVSIRASRWPMIYLVRYGVIPESWFDRLIAWELRRMARRTRLPRWSYQNVLFIYRKS
jgi:SAM-dependent methyltransferase